MKNEMRKQTRSSFENTFTWIGARGTKKEEGGRDRDRKEKDDDDDVEHWNMDG